MSEYSREIDRMIKQWHDSLDEEFKVINDIVFFHNRKFLDPEELQLFKNKIKEQIALIELEFFNNHIRPHIKQLAHDGGGWYSIIKMAKVNALTAQINSFCVYGDSLKDKEES